MSKRRLLLIGSVATRFCTRNNGKKTSMMHLDNNRKIVFNYCSQCKRTGKGSKRKEDIMLIWAFWLLWHNLTKNCLSLEMLPPPHKHN